MTTTTTTEPLISTAEAAKLLGVRPRTLVKWRRTREAVVPFVRVGRRTIRYRPGDVRAFIAEHLDATP